jgi:iron complex outermembrane receptor protein
MIMSSSKFLPVFSMALAFAGTAAADTAPTDTGPADSDRLETIIVTAQRREENLQDAPLAVTALSGAEMADRRLFSAEDISHDVVGLSFTANSPQAFELNIRGVTNTRLTAPTADQSVSTFIDDVYVSRSGSISANFYDLDHIEITRGPQGVLLGKNVSGGALSVYSAPPQFDPGADISVDVGNYDLHQATGFVTGPLGGDFAGRLSFQTIDHGGYAEDLEHGVPLEDLHSVQSRAQILFKPGDSDFRAHLTVEYNKDDSNGPNRVGVASPDCLPGPCLQPWSNGRAIISGIIGPLSPRESWPTWPTFAGDATPTPQGVHRENESAILRLEKDVLPDVSLTSISGYRGGHGNSFYDQSGLGPVNPYAATVDAQDPFLFAEPVYFEDKVNQYSEELRLLSSYPDSRIDWITGIYLQRIGVHQFNRFWGDSLIPPLATLCGESHWDDHGTNSDAAIFGQLGFKITNEWKFDVGARYTHDKKSGTQVATAVSTNCAGQPENDSPLTPLAVVPGFVAPYGQSWSKVTPQATLTFKPHEGLMSYFTVSEGYKGGGFQNDSSSAQVAELAYNPETVINYELGLKLGFLDGRARWNTALFDMDYKNLQVEQTIGPPCLCNIINNAASSTIRGFETELQLQATHAVYFFASGSYLDAKYKKFIDATGLDDGGHDLQRTPKYQVAVGVEGVTSVGSWSDALRARISFKEQGKMYWAPDNYTWEDAYGLLDGRVTLAPPNLRWNVSVWAKNITNTLYRTNIIPIFGDEVSSYGAPRTFGVSLNAKL